MENKGQYSMVNSEMLVRESHQYRKLEKLISFGFNSPKLASPLDTSYTGIPRSLLRGLLSKEKHNKGGLGARCNR